MSEETINLTVGVLPSISEDNKEVLVSKPKKKKTIKKSKITSVEIQETVSPWKRMLDESGNVYYYNSESCISAWLSPCSMCGTSSTKWCIACGKSFCDTDYEVVHDDITDMSEHTGSTTERLVKDELKTDEVHCIRCNITVACRICTVCWDPYCSDCFKASHSIGFLKTHKAVAYQRAKLGWTCIRSRVKDQPDVYRDGTTGKTTTDKPLELMTDLEKVYLRNFKKHKEAAEEYAEQIDVLRQELEALKFERDHLIVGNIGSSSSKIK
jgi:hypothetical protein